MLETQLCAELQQSSSIATQSFTYTLNLELQHWLRHHTRTRFLDLTSLPANQPTELRLSLLIGLQHLGL